MGNDLDTWIVPVLAVIGGDMQIFQVEIGVVVTGKWWQPDPGRNFQDNTHAIDSGY